MGGGLGTGNAEGAGKAAGAVLGVGGDAAITPAAHTNGRDTYVGYKIMNFSEINTKLSTLDQAGASASRAAQRRRPFPQVSVPATDPLRQSVTD